ncbi:WAT1-related protein [Hibiscus syriacus]|uniref:WAT1-related protein n=1 Tax=Hibiscus syriacus TaxID=106335 RepID=A0A6A3ACV1_HIBSY|nr:WAT1-related protein At4g08290-like [Hibiscus syriacus]XP_039003354.1 WAT1-related protein At4g08290-like [Hibiscus syriacus]KAE8701763.1 WAT1-related protein [Hibiscus syriacus]
MSEQLSNGPLSANFSKAKPYLLMIFLQFGSAGMYIISMVTLNQGMNRYVLVVYRNAFAALALAPFALVLERKTRPKMTFSIFLQIMTLGFLEPILDQGFVYLGMKYTSASFTSAIMNAVPSVTFVIALIFRLEHLNMKEIRSIAKVIGTVVTLSGALLMTLYKGPVIDLIWSRNTSSHGSSDSSDKHWIPGTLLILVGCVAWSCFYVLQSITIKKYTAEISLSSLICLAGTIQSLAIALAVEHHPSGWALGWNARLFAPLYSGIISSGITYYVQGLVMKTRGPVFVTAFNPLCMIIVAALGSAVLGEQIHLGSIIGGIVIAIGLYCVVWGKGKDFSPPSAPAKDDCNQQELPISEKYCATSTKLDIATIDAVQQSGK